MALCVRGCDKTLNKLGFFHFQPSRYNRLEKVDILEMTVSHLKSLQRQQLRDNYYFLYEKNIKNGYNDLLKLKSKIGKAQK